MRRRYVAGLMFSDDDTYVVLVRKSHPQWQEGRLNGVGGKVEDGEQPIDAMVREFREEAGLQTAPAEWRPFCVVRGQAVYDPKEDGQGWEVSWFLARRSQDAVLRLHGRHAGSREYIEVRPVVALNRQATVEHLQWLVPMAISSAVLLGDVVEIRRGRVEAVAVGS